MADRLDPPARPPPLAAPVGVGSPVPTATGTTSPSTTQAIDTAAVVASSSPAALPPGAYIANRFALFNTISWQIILGAPLILYAKSLGAPATVLGIITAMMPLLNMLQVPAAHWIPRFGYRRFVLAGWSSRTMLIVAIAVTPLLTGFTGEGTRLALLLGCLLVFNALRGATAGAWMPWMSDIIPEAVRGRFLSREQVFSAIGGLVAVLVSAAVLLGERPAPWQFASVFAISAIAAIVSLVYIRRIPDCDAPDRLARSGRRVPWKQMASWPPFRRLVGFNLAWVAVLGGMPTFTVAYLRGTVGFSDSLVLVTTAVAVLAALGTSLVLSRFVDRTAGPGHLRACVAVLAMTLAGWWAIAAGVLPASLAVIVPLQALTGAFSSAFIIGNNRLAMATFPLMGRNHFFAMFAVITSLGLGLSPILWGLLLDAIGGFEASHAGVGWNRYSIYFALCLGIAGAAAALSLRLMTPQQAVHETRRRGW
jgi:MFS family permease